MHIMQHAYLKTFIRLVV